MLSLIIGVFTGFVYYIFLYIRVKKYFKNKKKFYFYIWLSFILFGLFVIFISKAFVINFLWFTLGITFSQIFSIFVVYKKGI